MSASVLSDWLAQRLERGNGQPIYRQLHRLLQQAILSRDLPAGSQLPSSRLLAQELSIGRNTVTQVYEQLTLEGYVSSGTGRGTFVADAIYNMAGTALVIIINLCAGAFQVAVMIQQLQPAQGLLRAVPK